MSATEERQALLDVLTAMRVLEELANSYPPEHLDRVILTAAAKIAGQRAIDLRSAVTGERA